MNTTRIMICAATAAMLIATVALLGLQLDVSSLGTLLREALPWIAVVLNVAGTICSMRKSNACWVLWAVSCAAWLTVVIPAMDVAQMANWGFYLVLNIVGFVAWQQKPQQATAS